MRSDRIKISIALWGTLFACAALTFGQDPTPTPGSPGSELHGSFTFSSTRKDGRVDWKIDGSSASFITPELIEFKDVRAIFFAEDGTTTVATSEMALLDKESRRITTDKFVTIVTENSITTGTGLDWNQENKRGVLKKDVKVVYTHPEGKGLMQ